MGVIVYVKKIANIFQLQQRYLEWWGAGMVICLERGADLHS